MEMTFSFFSASGFGKAVDFLPQELSMPRRF